MPGHDRRNAHHLAVRANGRRCAAPDGGRLPAYGCSAGAGRGDARPPRRRVCDRARTACCRARLNAGSVPAVGLFAPLRGGARQCGRPQRAGCRRIPCARDPASRWGDRGPRPPPATGTVSADSAGFLTGVAGGFTRRSGQRDNGAWRPEPSSPRCAALTKKVPKRAWPKLSAGRGAKGQRFYDWAAVDIIPSTPGSHQILIRRSLTTGELAYFRCHSTETFAHGRRELAAKDWNLGWGHVNVQTSRRCKFG